MSMLNGTRKAQFREQKRRRKDNSRRHLLNTGIKKLRISSRSLLLPKARQIEKMKRRKTKRKARAWELFCSAWRFTISILHLKKQLVPEKPVKQLHSLGGCLFVVIILNG